jgi:hypothetical protein
MGLMQGMVGIDIIHHYITMAILILNSILSWFPTLVVSKVSLEETIDIYKYTSEEPSAAVYA